MAFNYSRSPHLISQLSRASLMITSTFSLSFPFPNGVAQGEVRTERETSPATEKAIRLCRSVFSFYTFWHIRQNEKWSDIYQQKLKLTYYIDGGDGMERRGRERESTRKASTFFKRRAGLLMSLCRIAFVRFLRREGFIITEWSV